MPSTGAAAVAVCLLLVLAGCSGGPADTTTSGVGVTTTPNTTTAVTSTATTSRTTTRTTTDTTHDRWIRGSAYTVNPETVALESSIPIGRLDPSTARIVNETIENGTTTVTRIGTTYDGSRYPVVVNGTYYDVNATLLEQERVTVHLFDVEGPLQEDTDQYEAAASDAVAFENLSAPDQRIVEASLPENRDLDTVSVDTFAQVPFEDGTAPSNATLADGTVHYVEYDGHYLRIEFKQEDVRDRSTYRYEASLVAESFDAYRPIATDRYVTNASNSTLPEGAQEVLIGTLQNGSIYYHSETPTIAPSYETFYYWTRDHRFVRYQGEIYRLDIMRVME